MRESETVSEMVMGTAMRKSQRHGKVGSHSPGWRVALCGNESVCDMEGENQLNRIELN